MSTANKRWLIFGGIAVFGLVLAIVAIVNTSASPRAFLRDHYACAPDPTDYDSATCTANGTPSEVAAAIAADTRPIDRGQDDGIEFLQYGDDIVAISSSGSTSKVSIDDYDTGYRNYGSHFVIFGWTSYRPSGGGFGGGGYGGGGYGGGGK